MKLIYTILLIFILTTSCFANPYLLAEPIEDVDYYFISIDDTYEYVQPSMDYLFLYNLNNLQDGLYKIGVIGFHEKWGEGQNITFNLKIKSNKNWKWLTIEKIPNPDDKYYDDRFTEPLEIKVKNQLTVPVPEVVSSSNGGCFINSIF